MEIDKAIKECDDQRLKTKYNNAIYVIQRALSLYKFEEVAFSFNGGKDSTVLLHLLRAGYYLHVKPDCSNGNLTHSKTNFPIRTIYFESPSAFPEIDSFTHETASIYGLQMETIRLDFKSGLDAITKEKPTKAIFLGTRIGDPNAFGQEQFSPSTPGWPPFMRVNPILDWSYRDVWSFLLKCKVKYCSLYDHGYTSIGSIYDTVPNSSLCISGSSSNKDQFRPAYMLFDGRSERAGRAKRNSRPSCEDVTIVSNGSSIVSSQQSRTPTASVISVGDEMLFGFVEDQLGLSLCRKLHSIGWAVSHSAVVRNDVDSVADEVEKQKCANDLVLIFGGVGPLHSDVTMAGIAKAFGVRLAPDEEYEEYLSQLADNHSGDLNDMAQLPEGITDLLHHERLHVPLIKCENVIILSATNVTELDKQWDCLIELTSSSGPLVLTTPFVSKQLSTTLTDVETAQYLSRLCLEFPDIYIGCYRKARVGPLIVNFVGKDRERIDLAVQQLCKKFKPGAFSAVNSG